MGTCLFTRISINMKILLKKYSENNMSFEPRVILNLLNNSKVLEHRKFMLAVFI